MDNLQVPAANLTWFAYSASRYRGFESASHNPEGTQSKIFQKIVAQNALTQFGIEHNFGDINGIKEFQDQVPIRSYEDFEPYIQLIATGVQNVLTAEQVQRFAVTSGSTKASKLIPYTKSLISEFQEGIDPWIYKLFRQYPSALLGKSYWSITPIGDKESYTHGGIPIGFDDEKSYFSPLTQWVLNSTMVTPSELAQIQDMEVFRYTTLRFLLQDRNLSWLSIWNPSFLPLLLEPLAKWNQSLIEDIASGTLSTVAALPLSIRNIILARCKGDKKRAKELEKVFGNRASTDYLGLNDAKQTIYEEIWPHISFISSWAHGHATTQIPQLQQYFPNAEIQPKGLLATEGFVSYPFRDNLSALSLRSHFFEFEEIENDKRKIRLAYELQEGMRYSVILTTSGGLYRYRLNDVIEVGGFHNKCPLIQFVGREAKVVDLLGEKLNEEFVHTSIREVLGRNEISPNFWMLAPEADSGVTPFYTLFLQLDPHSIDENKLFALASQVDVALKHGYHYEYSRRLGQLGECRIFIIHPEINAANVYLNVCKEQGQRLGDIKPAVLHSYSAWSRKFKGRFIRESAL